VRVRSAWHLVLAIWLGAGTPSVGAMTRVRERETVCPQPRGAEVGSALLVEYFEALPKKREGMDSELWAARVQSALEKFKKRVKDRYTEGTLIRLLASDNATNRQASILALGLIGSMQVNAALVKRLHDDDPQCREMAADALWAVWFRGDSEANNQELQRLMRQRDPEKALEGLDTLVRKAPGFAEAYNQRAILHFRLKNYDKCASDCEKVLQFNPCHFGAQAGLARCYMRLRKPKAALKAYRKAFEINPNMEGVEEAIRDLENALGEEGRTDDKK
jgi:tetratricopeptide (TPR) repeat protein